MKSELEVRKMFEALYPHSAKSENILKGVPEGTILIVTYRRQNERTAKQNSSLHLWFEQIAGELNKQNLGFVDLLGIGQRASGDRVKADLYMPVLKKKLGLTSTTQMARKDIDTMIDLVILELIEKGIFIEMPEFPNKELWIEKQKEAK